MLISGDQVNIRCCLRCGRGNSNVIEVDTNFRPFAPFIPGSRGVCMLESIGMSLHSLVQAYVDGPVSTGWTG
jgi:hypothetical protein